MMKKFLLSFLFLCISITVYCQMFITDPQSWWGQAPASVENVEIEVRTLGAYSETAIAFDIKLSDPYYFAGSELLEFTLDFKLKEGAVVNDSWLWIEEYISKGEVYEQGEGTQIYESIVDRQQDPSILAQLNSTDYNLRVYPLKWDSTRRVRISYLEPLDYLGKMATATLPLELLKHSDQSPENISVTIYNDGNYTSSFINSDDWMLEDIGSDFKVYRNTYVFDQSEYKDIPVSYTFTNPDVDYFLSTYEGVSDNYYQLVYFPEIETEVSQKNRMIVFDYDSFTSNLSFEEIKGKLRSALFAMDENDYFLICNSDFTTKFSSDDWELATEENIKDALSTIELNSEFSESRLSTLLPEALNRVEELNQSSEIIVFSPNNEYYTEQKAKALESVILEFYNNMVTDASISVMDYARTKPGNNIDGLVYHGNDYVYQKLAEATNGVYFSEVSGDDIYSSLVELFTSSAISYTDQFEFQLSVEDGFTYSNFNNLKNAIEVGGNKPIISTGKFIGGGLFDVKFNAKVGDQVYTDVQKLDANITDGLDERSMSIWNSELIKSLQHSGDYEDWRQVIQTSIEERLLSLHTVFLCLEPDFESISANNGEDGTIIILSTGDEPEPEFKLRVYPNPFVEKLNIEFPIEEVSFDDQIEINIFDSKGQLVERITKTNGLVVGANSFEWTPQYDLTDGMYVIQVQVNDKTYNQKVLHVKS